MTKVPDEWIELIIDSVDGHLRASVSYLAELPGRTIHTEVYLGLVESKEAAETIAAREAFARGHKSYRKLDRTQGDMTWHLVKMEVQGK